ncbi:MAG: HIT family protein [Eubacterium sp.]|nr:HIT family protein [Eubacterium sp.]
MIKDDCIFCKLANRVFPTNSIYEDDDFNVILDASPANRGHALILPKQHFDNLHEADDEILAKVMPLAKKIAAAVKKVTGCDGVNIIQNNGPAAGQTVFHLHIHVVPRFNDDFEFEWPHKSFSDEEQSATAAEIAAVLKGE